VRTEGENRTAEFFARLHKKGVTLMGLIRLIYSFIYKTRLYNKQHDFVRNRPTAVFSTHFRETPVFRPFYVPNVHVL
jgi:hypothetical protein